MTPHSCSCSDSDLLLAAHRALPLPALLRVQFHLLRCPACRERYRKFSAVSLHLASAMAPHSAPPNPYASIQMWGAALLCTLALSVAAWSAHASLVQPDISLCVHTPLSASVVHVPASKDHCVDPEIEFKKRTAK
ncbi:MAG: hypothetical protein QM758_01515 [Armatimonas sp.]